MLMTRLKCHVKALLKGMTLPDRVPPKARLASAPAIRPKHRRFLSDQPMRTEAYLRAASEYVGKLEPANFDYLYVKPFDCAPGNATYFTELYNVTNMIQTMSLPGGGRILEVGSGPGWITEMLMSLGFETDAIEPSDAMIRVAQERLAACRQHHRLKSPPRVAFHCMALEDAPFPDNTFDGVLFHESLHHIIDEDKGMAQCFRMLKPGGILGVSLEGVWQPGDRNLESTLEHEMATYGTLENPYTIPYLDYLLHKHGFEEVTRYHGVNGLFPTTTEHCTIKDVAQYPATAFNTVTACKPFPCPTTDSALDKTGARLTVVDQVVNYSGNVTLTVKLVNTGETAWLHRKRDTGQVAIGLYQGAPDSLNFREAHPRHPLPASLMPGEEKVVKLTYWLPPDYADKPWFLEPVNQGRFWFSLVGTLPAQVAFAPK